MKICQPHWNNLRKEIDDRGLSNFVAKNEEEALGIIERSLDGVSTAEDFDPLLMANFVIWKTALMVNGPHLISAQNNGRSCCPLCECELDGHNASHWTTLACDDALTEARRLKLVPELQ